MKQTQTARVHVAVGVIQNQQGLILIAKRPTHLHQGGKWEFPGGKVEQGESTTQALIRELHEEVGLIVENSTPLMQISHNYSDKRVLLDIHKVTEFSGAAVGLEGQEIQWVSRANLSQYQFPVANQAIVTKLQESL